MHTGLLRTCVAGSVLLGLSACNQHGLASEQIAAGATGPREPAVSYLQTAREAEASWLPSALGPAKYRAAIAQVDFSRQMLVAFASGEQQNFSGTIRISRVYEYTGVSSRPINVLVEIGVFPQECFSGAMSRPFAIAVVERPLHISSSRGYDVQNFAASCKQTLRPNNSFKPKPLRGSA
jgi:hypothetical protein